MRSVVGLMLGLSIVLSLGGAVSAASEKTSVKSLQATALRQIKRKDYAAAKTTLQMLLETDPASLDAHLLLGKAHYGLKEYKAPAEQFGLALAQTKEADVQNRLYYDRAQSEYFGQMYDAAIADLTKLIELKGPSEDIYLERASAYDAMGKPEAAIEDLSKAIALEPRSSELFLKRALIHKFLKNNDKALDDFNNATKLNPALATWRASFNRDRGEHNAAIDDFTTAIQANKGCGRAAQLCNRAMVYADLDHHRKAIKDLNDALKLEPKRADYFANRAISYFGVSDFKNAIEDMNDAIKLEPNNADFYFKRAEAKNADGQKEAAVKDYDEAIRLQSNKKAATLYYHRRAIIAGELNKHDQALADLSRAVGDAAESADLWFERGMEYESCEKWAEAEADFSKAIELQGSFATAYKHRAKVRAKLGNTEGAMDDLKTSMRIYDSENDMFGMAEVRRMIAKIQK